MELAWRDQQTKTLDSANQSIHLSPRSKIGSDDTPGSALQRCDNPPASRVLGAAPTLGNGKDLDPVVTIVRRRPRCQPLPLLTVVSLAFLSTFAIQHPTSLRSLRRVRQPQYLWRQVNGTSCQGPVRHTIYTIATAAPLPLRSGLKTLVSTVLIIEIPDRILGQLELHTFEDLGTDTRI